MDIKDMVVNPKDYKGMLELMKHHSEFDLPLNGTNEDGEHVIISINEHNITIQTCQSNDWLRTNIYYDDGTSEELYEK